jgi:hypothetical protein
MDRDANMDSDIEPMKELKHREAVARQRIKASARGLKRTVVTRVQREQKNHPWVLPIAGLCVGVLVPFLIPMRRNGTRRRPARVKSHAGQRSAFMDVLVEAGGALAMTAAQVLGTQVRQLLASTSRCAPGESNGRSR